MHLLPAFVCVLGMETNLEVHVLPLLNVYLLNTGSDVGLDSLAQEMENNPNVLFCHLDYVVDRMEPAQGSTPFGDITGVGESADRTVEQFCRWI